LQYNTQDKKNSTKNEKSELKLLNIHYINTINDKNKTLKIILQIRIK